MARWLTIVQIKYAIPTLRPGTGYPSGRSRRDRTYPDQWAQATLWSWRAMGGQDPNGTVLA